MPRGRKGTMTSQWVDEARLRLKALHEKVPEKLQAISKQETVKQLAEDIRSLQAKGFSLKEIVAGVNGGANEFTSASLRSYLKLIDEPRKIKAERPAKEKVTPDAEVATARQTKKANAPRSETDRERSRGEKGRAVLEPKRRESRPKVSDGGSFPLVERPI